MNVRDYLKARWEVENYEHTHNVLEEIKKEFPIGTPIYDVDGKYLGKVYNYHKFTDIFTLALYDDNCNDYGMKGCTVVIHRIQL